jgi:Arc/MetJ-type ribon-helix-helix transcriptional regulator
VGCAGLGFAVAQVVTRMLVAQVDALVEAGILESRSMVVRRGLEQLVHRLERERIGAEIVEGYRPMPQTEEELG